MPTQDLIIINEGDPAFRIQGRLGASQTFKSGAPVTITSNRVVTAPADTTEVLDGEALGFALTPASGIHSGSRTGAANGFGAATEDYVTVVPINAPGLRMKTRNFWATGAGSAATPDGANIGQQLQLSFATFSSTNRWGIEETAAVSGTDLVCYIEAVLDVNGIPLKTTDTTGGVWVVFVPSALNSIIGG